jgi:hypothetical protein
VPIFTTKITGSTGSGIVEFSGSSFQNAGVMTSMGFGNASTINVETTTPEGYNFVLYGPIIIGGDGTFNIAANTHVKIKDIDDV